MVAVYHYFILLLYQIAEASHKKKLLTYLQIFIQF
jgi:hypothetical protein